MLKGSKSVRLNLSDTDGTGYDGLMREIRQGTIRTIGKTTKMTEDDNNNI